MQNWLYFQLLLLLLLLLLLYWNLLSKLIAVTVPGREQHNLYSRDSTSLWCLFDSWEAVLSFILSKAKNLRFSFFLLFLCPGTSLLHSFIKALNTFERNFLIKKDSFLFTLSNLVPWHTCTARLDAAIPGHFWELGSSAPAAHKGVHRSTTSPHQGPFPCSAASLEKSGSLCWWLTVGLSRVGWCHVAPVLLFLRARVITCTPALSSSLGNYVQIHELSPADSGMCTILLHSSKSDCMQGCVQPLLWSALGGCGSGQAGVFLPNTYCCCQG